MKTSIIKKLASLAISTTGLLVVLIIWTLYSRGLSPLIMPSPLETWAALQELLGSGKLINNLLITVRRTVIGYGLALAVGCLVAVLLYSCSLCRKIFRPLVTIIQTTPPVIWLALAVTWFGIAEDITPIFLIFIVTFPIIFINIFEGLQDLDQELLEMARVYRATAKQLYLDIYFPALVPHLVSALSIGLAFAWKSSIFAEFIGSSSGIGYELSMANANLETARLFAWALVLVSLMLAVEYLLIRPLYRKVTEWRHD